MAEDPAHLGLMAMAFTEVSLGHGLTARPGRQTVHTLILPPTTFTSMGQRLGRASL